MKRTYSKRYRTGRSISLPVAIGTVVLLALVGWLALTGTQGGGGVEIPHIHGMGFSSDGRQLIVAAHDGLRIFAEGRWDIPALPRHDYMGYSPVDNGFYSSGHPHPSTNMVNPFGLIKSTDGGTTLARLGFEGESDFHLMSVGHRSHAIYVVNATSNSRLPAGLHYSLDDGETWQPSAAQGITASPIQIAVHPTEASTVALATKGGLFLSSNFGQAFERIGENASVTAVHFSPDGDRLFFGNTGLYVYDLTRRQVSSLPTPAISGNDAIGYLAVNPVRSNEMALATFNGNIYFSTDGGRSWQPIAQDGQGRTDDK